MKNAFTVDLEDWFCSHNLRGQIDYDSWDMLPKRVEINTVKILDLLSKNNCKGTFFVLGWIADRYPDLIKIIAREGHEIASHGYSHTLLTDLNPATFESDVQKSTKAIFSACGIIPRGFRAPAFTIVPSTIWALEVLSRCKFEYDSSIYPIGVHPDYGIGDAPLGIYETDKKIIEFPLSCSDLFGMRIPCSGGAYFRVMPYRVYKHLVDKILDARRRFIFYIHPWEIDCEMPNVTLSTTKRWRHYTNISSTNGKLERLLKDYEFTSIENILKEQNVFMDAVR